MKVLDLFSGIGGFSLGLERAGMETVAFCEIKGFCKHVLRKHWAQPIYDDIKELTGDQIGRDGFTDINLICGGFPCQDLSTVGNRSGIRSDKTSLYTEMLRIISERRPRFAVFENVANLLIGDEGRWMAQFLYDLAEIGYDAEWHCISASNVGANHIRDRIWVIAYPQGSTISNSIFQGVPQDIFRKGQLRGSAWRPIPGTYWETDQPRLDEVDDGISGWVGEVSGYGNAVVPQIPEIIGRAIMEIENHGMQ